jgi:hypothetical protein
MSERDTLDTQIAGISDPGPYAVDQQERSIRRVKTTDMRRPFEAPAPDRSLPRVIEARRRLESIRSTGRAWLNGREVGDTDPRVAHLNALYD